MNKEQMIKDLGGELFATGEENTAFAQYFVGQSYLNMLTTEGVGIGNVTFEPGCRNNWHIHHGGGQILLVTGGTWMVPGVGKTGTAAESGRCRQHPGRGQALAWGCQRQLVCTSRRRSTGREQKQRMVRTGQ